MTANKHTRLFVGSPIRLGTKFSYMNGKERSATLKNYHFFLKSCMSPSLFSLYIFLFFFFSTSGPRCVGYILIKPQYSSFLSNLFTFLFITHTFLLPLYSVHHPFTFFALFFLFFFSLFIFRILRSSNNDTNRC